MKRYLVVRSMAVSMTVVCGLAVPAPRAVAQGQVFVTATQDIGDPFGGTSRISKANVDGYSQRLRLNADQKASATALHEGYDAAVSQANKEFQAGMEDMRKSAEETDDHTVFMEKMPKLRDTLNKKTKDLEKGFMSDLQALLTTEQQPNWTAVERQRRRETQLRPGSVSGEGVNLLDVVEGMRLSEDAQAKITEPLANYEVDMDRALVAKQKVLDDLPGFEPGRGFDMEAFQERMSKTREAGIKVKEVNQAHQRKIEGLLPDDSKPKFSDAVRKATYPQVYRPSRIARSIDAAAKFEDLNQGQKDSLATLKASYERDAGALNDTWAGEIEADEKKGGNGGEMAMPGGGRMRVMMGEEDDKSPLAQARKARRELDDKTKGRLDFVLSKEQKERLPKEPEGGRMIRGGVGGGTEIIIGR